MSLEHIVSNTLLEDEFYRVSGGPWSEGRPPIASSKLGTKCLCKGHNQDLSDLDDAIGSFRDALYEARRIELVRARLPTRDRMSVRRFSIDGARIERWTLKVAFGLASSLRQPERWTPPAEWVEVVYGKRPIPHGFELGLVAVAGDTISNEQEFHVRLLDTEGGSSGEPLGVEVVVLGGWRFVMSWTRPLREIEGVVLFGDRWVDPRRDVVYRPRRFDVGSAAPHRIYLDFSWPE